MRPKKLKENKPYKLTVRVTDSQYSYILRLSKNLCLCNKSLSLYFR